jgi:hypothetical protein
VLCMFKFALKITELFASHISWVPCHHDMARPQVADGGKASRYGG